MIGFQYGVLLEIEKLIFGEELANTESSFGPSLKYTERNKIYKYKGRYFRAYRYLYRETGILIPDANYFEQILLSELSTTLNKITPESFDHDEDYGWYLPDFGNTMNRMFIPSYETISNANVQAKTLPLDKVDYSHILVNKPLTSYNTSNDLITPDSNIKFREWFSPAFHILKFPNKNLLINLPEPGNALFEGSMNSPEYIHRLAALRFKAVYPGDAKTLISQRVESGEWFGR